LDVRLFPFILNNTIWAYVQHPFNDTPFQPRSFNQALEAPMRCGWLRRGIALKNTVVMPAGAEEKTALSLTKRLNEPGAWENSAVLTDT